MRVRLRTILVNSLMAVLALTLCLAIAEAVVRVWTPQPIGLSLRDRYGLVMHYPGITRYLPQYGHRVSFNRAGMRDREHAVERTPGVFRILLLGDSFMEALQVPFDSSVPSLLETALVERTGRQTEVVNASVGGWGTEDQLRYLSRYGLQYEPDLIMVAMTLHNDVSDNLRQQWYTIENGRLLERPVTSLSSWAYRKVQLEAFVASHLHLYQLWRRVQRKDVIRRVGTDLEVHVTNLFRDPSPPEIAEGFQLTEHLLAAIRDQATAVGARVMLVTLPIKLQLSETDFRHFMRQRGVPEADVDIERPQRVIGDIARRAGLPVVDLLPRFRQWTGDNGQPLYGDHWTEAGHRLAVEVMTEGVMQHGGVGQPRP